MLFAGDIVHPFDLDKNAFIDIAQTVVVFVRMGRIGNYCDGYNLLFQHFNIFSLFFVDGSSCMFTLLSSQIHFSLFAAECVVFFVAIGGIVGIFFQ